MTPWPEIARSVSIATAHTFAASSILPVYFPPASLVANPTDAAGNSSELGPCVAQDTIFANGVDY